MDTAALPTWAVQPPRAVDDARRLAKALAATDPHWAGAVEATIEWTQGGAPAPTTSEPAGYVSAARAQAEALESLIVATAEDGLPSGRVADAVARTLAWLTVPDRAAPIRLPQRHPDGTLMDEDTLYQRALVGRSPDHETRQRLRDQARRDAAESARLATIIDSVT